MNGKDFLFEWITVAVFCGLVGAQIFLPPVVSLANNGDFGKMIGRFGLGPVSDGPDSEIVYAPTEYAFHPARYLLFPNLSSELLLVIPAVLIGWATGPTLFDLRIMGAVHAVVLLAGFVLLVRLTRKLPAGRRALLLLLMVVVLSDVHYVSHLNSFYMDTAAWLGLVLTLATGLRLMMEQVTRRSVVLFSASACFLVASKPPHALLALLLFPLALSAVWRGRRDEAGVLAAFSNLATGAFTLALAPPAERAANLYSATFIRVPQAAADPATALREMGLGPEFDAHLGHYGYEKGAPGPEWFARFAQQHSYGRLALWYLRHPLSTLKVLYSDLAGPA